jgi:hypothetical protein
MNKKHVVSIGDTLFDHPSLGMINVSADSSPDGSRCEVEPTRHTNACVDHCIGKKKYLLGNKSHAQVPYMLTWETCNASHVHHKWLHERGMFSW